MVHTIVEGSKFSFASWLPNVKRALPSLIHCLGVLSEVVVTALSAPLGQSGIADSAFEPYVLLSVSAQRAYLRLHVLEGQDRERARRRGAVPWVQGCGQHGQESVLSEAWVLRWACDRLNLLSESLWAHCSHKLHSQILWFAWSWDLFLLRSYTTALKLLLLLCFIFMNYSSESII